MKDTFYFRNNFRLILFKKRRISFTHSRMSPRMCVVVYTFLMCVCMSFIILIFFFVFFLARKKRATSWRNINFIKYSINLTCKPDVNKLNCISGAIVDWSSFYQIHIQCICRQVLTYIHKFVIYFQADFYLPL